MSKLFEAFFWIEPMKSQEFSAYDLTRVLWHYPDDVSAIAKEFINIPQFCFPDIEKTMIEKAEKAKIEHYVFTLTDKDGKRSYGICLRGLFRSEGRRYDVKRRTRHCICFVTKYPYFTLFRTVLSQIFATTMLEQIPKSARKILDVIYNPDNLNIDNGYTINMNNVMFPEEILQLFPPTIILPLNTLNVQIPTSDQLGFHRNDVAVLPLLEALGVEGFLVLLTTVLSEKRIIFYADNVETLSSAMLALLAMIYPFTWQSVFLPLLPTKLLAYVCAPYPYLIGIRRHQLGEVNKQPVGDVVLVDLDSGELNTRGTVVTRDIVGDSGNTLKQASETLDMLARTAGGFASKMFKTATGVQTQTGADSQSGATKDIMVCVINDLRNVLASKPGNISLHAMFRDAASAVSKTSAEAAKIHWELESDKSVKDCILLFFIYLFCDLDESMNMNYVLLQQQQEMQSKFVQLKKNRNSSTTSHPAQQLAASKEQGKSRASKIDLEKIYDFDLFMKKKRHLGQETPGLIAFLGDFLQTEVMTTFCEEKYTRMISKTNEHQTTSNLEAMATNNEDQLFYIICDELRTKSITPTIPNIKTIISNIRLYQEKLQLQDNLSDTTSKLRGLDLHSLTINYTGGSTGSAAASNSLMAADLSPTTRGSIDGQSSPSYGVPIFETTRDPQVIAVCQDSFQTSLYPKIMKTISIRLFCCKAAGGRGSAGLAGKLTLILLRSLLIEGSENVLTYSIDLIPIIRELIHLKDKSSVSSTTGAKIIQPAGIAVQQGLEMLSVSTQYAQEIIPYAKHVLSLIVDHKMLQTRRVYSILVRSNSIPTHRVNNLLPKDYYRVLVTGRLPSFVAVHNRCRPVPDCRIFPELTTYNLNRTEPVSISKDDDGYDDGDDNEDNRIESRSHISGKSRTKVLSAPAVSSNVDDNSNPIHQISRSANSSPLATTTLTRPKSSNSNKGSKTVAVLEPPSDAPDLIVFSPLDDAHQGEVTTKSTDTTFTPLPTDVFNENMKYRIVNKDTGDIFDIRYDADKTLPNNGKVVDPKALVRLPKPPVNNSRNFASFSNFQSNSPRQGLNTAHTSSQGRQSRAPFSPSNSVEPIPSLTGRNLPHVNMQAHMLTRPNTEPPLLSTQPLPLNSSSLTTNMNTPYMIPGTFGNETTPGFTATSLSGQPAIPPRPAMLNMPTQSHPSKPATYQQAAFSSGYSSNHSVVQNPYLTQPVAMIPVQLQSQQNPHLSLGRGSSNQMLPNTLTAIPPNGPLQTSVPNAFSIGPGPSGSLQGGTSARDIKPSTSTRDPFSDLGNVKKM